jgi:hypothetical protein
MADNVGYTPGTGASVAADEIGGNLHQRVKIGVGEDGTAVDVSSTNPMPVIGTIIQDASASATPVLLVGGKTPAGIAKSFETNGSGHLHIADGGGSITVDGPLTDAQLRATAVPVSGNVGVTGSVAVTGPLTNAELRAASFEVEDKGVWWMLQRIFALLTSPPGFDSSLKRHRNTAIIESGTVTTVSTVSTVTTVTTVSGLTNIDGRNGAMLINQTNLSAWADCARARIT